MTNLCQSLICIRGAYVNTHFVISVCKHRKEPARADETIELKAMDLWIHRNGRWNQWIYFYLDLLSCSFQLGVLTGFFTYWRWFMRKFSPSIREILDQPLQPALHHICTSMYLNIIFFTNSSVVLLVYYKKNTIFRGLIIL